MKLGLKLIGLVGLVSLGGVVLSLSIGFVNVSICATDRRRMG